MPEVNVLEPGVTVILPSKPAALAVASVATALVNVRGMLLPVIVAAFDKKIYELPEEEPKTFVPAGIPEPLIVSPITLEGPVVVTIRIESVIVLPVKPVAVLATLVLNEPAPEIVPAAPKSSLPNTTADELTVIFLDKATSLLSAT